MFDWAKSADTADSPHQRPWSLMITLHLPPVEPRAAQEVVLD